MATIHTASSTKARAAERQALSGEWTSADTIVPTERMHNDMKRNEVHSATTKPRVSHPWLAEERAQRNTSPALTCESTGKHPAQHSFEGGAQVERKHTD
jgi:hypothetical protein